MSNGSESEASTPTPHELRTMVEGTREELGRTVEALAAKADVRTRAKVKVADVKARVRDKVGNVKAQAADKADAVRAKLGESAIGVDADVGEGSVQAVYLVEESVVDPVREGVAASRELVAARVRQVTDAIRRRPGPAIAAASPGCGRPDDHADPAERRVRTVGRPIAACPPMRPAERRPVR